MNRYSELIQKASDILNSQGYIVMAALAPKTSTDQPGLLYRGHDYSAIGRAADKVLPMTYEWGYTYLHQCYMLCVNASLRHNFQKNIAGL